MKRVDQGSLKIEIGRTRSVRPNLNEISQVEIAKSLEEKICVTYDRLALFADMELPDVFTVDPSESRIYLINQVSFFTHDVQSAKC
jgi:hypothetical protein